FSKTCRISLTVRFRLSVTTFTNMATPPGAYPSYMISSSCPPSRSPVPFWIARLMLSAGILTPCASWIAVRNRGLPSASPPPIRAAIVISLMSLVNMRPRLASMAPFLCLMLCHLEWPDIDYSFNLCHFSASVYHRPMGQRESHKKGSGLVRTSEKSPNVSERLFPSLHHRKEGNVADDSFPAFIPI